MCLDCDRAGYDFVREKTAGREYDVFLGVAYGTHGKGKYNERKNRHISEKKPQKSFQTL